MARFDVYVAPIGFMVDVQTNYLYGLNTRLMVPLIPVGMAPLPASRLNPILDVNGERCALQPQLMTAVPSRGLGKPVGNVDAHYDEIASALSMILNGF